MKPLAPGQLLMNSNALLPACDYFNAPNDPKAGGMTCNTSLYFAKIQRTDYKNIKATFTLCD